MIANAFSLADASLTPRCRLAVGVLNIAVGVLNIDVNDRSKPEIRHFVSPRIVICGFGRYETVVKVYQKFCETKDRSEHDAAEF